MNLKIYSCIDDVTDVPTTPITLISKIPTNSLLIASVSPDMLTGAPESVGVIEIANLGNGRKIIRFTNSSASTEPPRIAVYAATVNADITKIKWNKITTTDITDI